MRRLGALLLVFVLAAAACSSDDDAQDGSRSTPSTEAEQDAPVRVVQLNLLHGLFCPPETDSCQAPDRVQIFTELAEAADCPDLIGLQEIGARLEELLPAAVASMCDGEYSIRWQGADSPDREMVLTRLPVVDEGYLDIANFPWEAYWVRVRSDQGPVDFLTTHFASSSNNPECAPDRCPPICPAGISTNECNAAQVVDFFKAREGAAITIASGDFNARPDSPTVAHLLNAGFRDAWLAAGNRECDPATHVGCTGGGSQPEPFVGIDTEAGPGFDGRIDYVMVRGGPDCKPEIDAEGFAVEPRRDPLNGLWWPSDHGGVLAEISCR
jgi:endonuclease/exonuclease/phosphatase family metal-dependent hydrolase